MLRVIEMIGKYTITNRGLSRTKVRTYQTLLSPILLVAPEGRGDRTSPCNIILRNFEALEIFYISKKFLYKKNNFEVLEIFYISKKFLYFLYRNFLLM